jgi:hypothetical protein
MFHGPKLDLRNGTAGQHALGFFIIISVIASLRNCKEFRSQGSSVSG